MIGNLIDNHSEPWVQTSDSIEHETDKAIERTVEIPQQPSNGGPKKAKSTALCPTGTRLMPISVVGLSTCKTTACMWNWSGHQNRPSQHSNWVGNPYKHQNKTPAQWWGAKVSALLLSVLSWKINDQPLLCEAPMFVGQSKANARAAKSCWRCPGAYTQDANLCRM